MAIVYLGNFGDGSARMAAIAVAAAFSLLPDIDMVRSKAGRVLQPFAVLASSLFHHRGFLHSFVFAAAVYFSMRYFFSDETALAATIGYGSHLLLDILTREGIMPLSPFSKKRLKGIVRTGGLAEKLLLAGLATLLLARVA